MRQPLRDYDAREEAFELVGEERDLEDQRPARRLPRVLLSVLVMAVFAGGLWFAYHEGARHAGAGRGGDGIPLIRADRSPDKVKPENPGGMKIPNQNALIFNEKPGMPKIERLLPPAEAPMPRPASPPVMPAATPARPPASRPAPVEQAARPPSPAVEMPPAPTGRARPEQRSEPHPATAEPVGRPPPATTVTGKVQVRLGSLRSPEAARAEWNRLKEENPDLLGRLHAVAVRTDLGEKGIYYRIEAGPFPDAAAAERLCGELKRRNFGCLLAR
jgi:cell division septation protein DedD